MSGLILPEDCFVALLYGFSKQFDVRRVAPAVHIVGNACGVVYGREFLLEIGLEGVRRDEPVYQRIDKIRFFFGEIYEIVDVHASRRHAAELIDIGVQLGHGKAGALESVYVSINGSW